jgi:cytoskeletal protein RodZ
MDNDLTARRSGDVVKRLRNLTFIFVFLLLGNLWVLSLVGWREVKRQIKATTDSAATTAVTPVTPRQLATSTKAITPTETVTQTVKPGQEAASTATATVTPTVMI